MSDHVTTLTSTGPDASPVTTVLRGATTFNLTTTTGKHVQFLLKQTRSYGPSYGPAGGVIVTCVMS